MLREFLGECVTEYISKVVIFCRYVCHIRQGCGTGHSADARCRRLEGVLLSSIFSTCSNKSGGEMIDILGVTDAEKEGMVGVGIDGFHMAVEAVGISELAWQPRLE